MIRYSIQILVLTLLLGACASLPPADPKLSAKLNEEALNAAAEKDFSTSVAKFNEAIRYNPTNSQLYLQQAEILETLQNFDRAAETLKLGLKRVTDRNDELLPRMHYRLGLLLSREKKNHGAANRSLEELDEATLRDDLEGMIALYAGDPDRALRLFSQALETVPDPDQQARIYYHASLAHLERGDLVESKNALFHAINNARSLALKQHIRLLFDQIR